MTRLDPGVQGLPAAAAAAASPAAAAAADAFPAAAVERQG